MTSPVDASFEIAGRKVGADAPVYIVAELSANHGGDLDAARALVHAAAEAGADAVKLQTYKPGTITLDCSDPPFRIEGGTLWDGRVLHDLYAEAQTPWEWHPHLDALARELGMGCFSSVFDATSIAFLEGLDAPAYKVASFELVDIPLLEALAATRKPVILSTGMATLEEVDEAVRCLREHGSGPIALLRASSAYPAPAEAIQLRTIPHLAERFGVVVGLSDHTLGIAVPVAAVSLGAKIIEKHLTQSRDQPGPDAAFSLEPHEFCAMVEAVRTAERALGEIARGPSDHERSSLAFRRSLFVVEDVKAGEAFTADNLRSIRPAAGLHTRHLAELLGRRAQRDIRRGTPMAWDLVAPHDSMDAKRSGLVLRRATAGDCALLHDWLQDPLRRQMAFSQAPVSREEHDRWFEARLDDPGCWLYIAIDEAGEPIGQVRLDLGDDTEAEISISIDARCRGRGHATTAIREAVARATEHGGLTSIHAFIKRENAASIRAFHNAGFSIDESLERDGSSAVGMVRVLDGAG